MVVPPAPRPPRKLRAPLSAIPEVEDRHVLACEGILAVWPKTDGEDHRRVGCNEASLVMRLIHWEKTNPAYTMAVLVESAVTFCKAPHFRFPAPEVYFSKALPTDDRKAHFKETADAIVNRNRRRESTAMVPPAPINLRPSPGASA